MEDKSPLGHFRGGFREFAWVQMRRGLQDWADTEHKAHQFICKVPGGIKHQRTRKTKQKNPGKEI